MRLRSHERALLTQTAFTTKTDEITIRNTDFDIDLSNPIEPSRLKQVVSERAE